MMSDLAQGAVIVLALVVTTAAAIVVPQAAVQRQVVRHLGDELSDAEKVRQLEEVSEYLAKLQEKADLVEQKAEERVKK